MNLQPQDVPDLQETPVEEPASAALLPEAIDQDQRAYVDVEQNVYIESSVIMVPERTIREPSDVAKEIVRYRNPRLQLINSGRVIVLAEKAIIIGIIGYCSANYDSGYILVFHRNNVVVVLFACGKNLGEDYVIRLAKKIDGNVIKSPTKEEIAIRETEQAVPTPQGVDNSPVEESTADICTSLDLSPEECKNSGTHSYLGNWVIHVSTDQCYYGDHASTTELQYDATFTFSQSAVTYCWSGEHPNCIELSKKDQNMYWSSKG